MVYTGDILIQQLDDDGSFDVKFENGQPNMTDGLETVSILAIFGEDWWGNDIVSSESEKMQSEFPGVIRRNVVTDKTKNDGTKAIEKATAFMVTEKIASSITVTGEIFSVHGIQWLVEIGSVTSASKYYINWERGVLTANMVA